MIERELGSFARWSIGEIVRDYRLAHPVCQYTGCVAATQDIHHNVPMATIIESGIALLSTEDLTEAEKIYSKASLDFQPFSLPFDHKFTRYIAERHKENILMAVCRDHHYKIEGKVKRSVA